MRPISVLVVAGCAWMALAPPARLHGQTSSVGDESERGVAERSDRSDPGGHGIVGARPDRRRAIVGLWSMHPYEPQFPELDWTRGGGVQFSQWFMATFINSYDDRSFILGLERYWFTGRASALTFGLGYRVGLLTGYDERLFGLAGHTPVLPFGGLLGWVDLGPVALDSFYVWRAITVEAAIRF